MNHTLSQYDTSVSRARHIFSQKAKDYGTSWRVYRPVSIADQIYIKAKRIRTIQEKQENKVGDHIGSEFEGILNYAVIGIIQGRLGQENHDSLDLDKAISLYDEVIIEARNLMQKKNHDYGEAWRDMSQESFADLILAKILRIKQIIAHQGVTLISEGVESNFFDILNYSVFALIGISEGRHRN